MEANPIEVIHEPLEVTDMPIMTGAKQGRVTLARVVQVLGNLNGQPRMSSKKSAAAGGALREIYPALSPAVAASIANHMKIVVAPTRSSYCITCDIISRRRFRSSSPRPR